MQLESLNVLLVEDNPDHTEMIKRCFEEHKLPNRIHHVVDGETALDFVFRRGDYADPKKSPRPHVILLDLRLPKIDGLDVLKQIKASEELKVIPVVILTTSDADKDVANSYKNHANSYLVKPIDFDSFNQLINDLGFYWLGWNRHPFSNSNMKH